HSLLSTLSLHDALPIYLLFHVFHELPQADRGGLARVRAPRVLILDVLFEDGLQLPLTEQRIDVALRAQRKCFIAERASACGRGRSEEHTSELQSLTNLV